MLRMPGKTYEGPFLPLTPEELEIRNRLKEGVYYLSDEIGERNMGKMDNLQKAAEYIAKKFNEAGLSVKEQTFEVNGISVKNIIGEKMPEKMPEKKAEKMPEYDLEINPEYDPKIDTVNNTHNTPIIVVGAHYDTVHGTPGADDNASGVAAILEIAHLLKNKKFPKIIQFVAFVNEEPPFFYSRNMGSWQFANEAYRSKKNIHAMLSIESIGFYQEEKESQYYPFPLGFFYPTEGNFIGFVGNLSSKRLVHQTITAFRISTPFPSQGISAPSWVPGIAWSDQWAFWRHKYKAVMITATALFRNPNYHNPRDLPNTLDYDRMSRVVLGISKVVIDLANGND